MKKIVKIFSLLLIAGLFLSILPNMAEAAAFRTVRFKLTSTSKIAWANLYIDGRNRGRVSRDSYTPVRLRTGRSYRVEARRFWNGQSWQRSKSVYVSSASAMPVTEFLHPMSTGGSSGMSRMKTVQFKLTSSSKIAWGTLYIDGVNRGQVSRSSYTTVRLRAGRTYQVSVRRYWNGQSWRRDKSVFVSRGSSVQTEFLHPMAR